MSQASGYQGAPGTFDTKNPTLIPNVYDYQAGPNGSCSAVSPAQQIINNPRLAGTNAITVGGTAHAGDLLAVTVSNKVLPGGAVTFTHAVAAGPESLAEAAEALAASCNNNSTLQQHDLYATSYNGVVTLHQLGPLAAFSTVTTAVSGGSHTTTLSSANSGAFTGGSGPVVPLNNAQLANVGGQVLNLRYGMPLLLSYPQLKNLVNSGSAAK